MDTPTGNDLASDPGKPHELTAEIVAAYVAKNAVPLEALPGLIKDVFHALTGPMQIEALPVAETRPAIPVHRSVMPDHLVCLEDGKRFKSLKRHLRTSHDMTPEQYRKKWNLPGDYPMVAPDYAAARSDLARKFRLGHKRRPPVRASK